MCMGEKYVEKSTKNMASISDKTTAESSERTHSVFDAYHDSASESDESLDDESDSNYYITIRRYVKKCQLSIDLTQSGCLQQLFDS